MYSSEKLREAMLRTYNALGYNSLYLIRIVV